MKIFRRKPEKPLVDQQQDIAGKIAAHILNTQRRLADCMNNRTAGFSKTTWLRLLIAFIVGFGSYCCWILVQAFNS